MGYQIPALTAVVRCSVLPVGELAYDEVLSLVPKDYWSVTTDNWWLQSLVADLLGVYAGFEALRYLTSVVSIVRTEQLATTFMAVNELIVAIAELPEPFIRATLFYDESAENVRQSIVEASATRSLSDGGDYSARLFFSFLLSQAAALEEARQTNGCLLYVQLQP